MSSWAGLVCVLSSVCFGGGAVPVGIIALFENVPGCFHSGLCTTVNLAVIWGAGSVFEVPLFGEVAKFCSNELGAVACQAYHRNTMAGKGLLYA